MFEWVLKWIYGVPFKARRDQRENEPDVADELTSYLAGQISIPRKAEPVLKTVDKLRDSEKEPEEKLPAIYLLLEQYLVEVDPHERFERTTLREHIQDKFPSLSSRGEFRIIFTAPDRQKVLLCRTFLERILDRTAVLLGDKNQRSLAAVNQWLETIPHVPKQPVPFDLTDDLPDSDSAWFDLLLSLSRRLYHFLNKTLGAAADRIYEKVYREIEYSYRGLETFHVAVQLLPEELLDEHKIQVLNQSRRLSNKENQLHTIQQQLLARDRELRETQEELQAVLHTVGEGILTIDAEGVIVLVNREVTAIWGYAKEELIGQHITRLLADYSTPSGASIQSRFMARKIPEILGCRVEMKGETKDGDRFPIEVHVNKTRIGDRQLFTIAAHDITERKHAHAELLEAKEKAEEMSRLKSAFLANMSHEIRTPLTAILGFAEIIGDEDVGNPSEFTELIQRSGNRLLNTLNSVLDMAQLEAGSKSIKPETVNVTRKIAETAELFQSQAEEKGLSLEIRAPEEPVTAQLDVSCLNRIVNNLLSNAIKFTQQGNVTVSTYQQDEQVVLIVEDTGIGMDEEFKSRVFEAFRQESTGLDRAYEGSGLGLTITQRLVNMMNGSIQLESTKGEGTVFTVTLPLEIQEEMPTPLANLKVQSG